jgi:hypothetical protein
MNLLLVALALGGYTGAATVDLRYVPHADEFHGGQTLAPQEARGAVESLTEARTYSFRFGGGERRAAIGMRGDKQVLLIDTDGDGRLDGERAWPMQDMGYQERFGPFPMRFERQGRPLLSHYEIVRFTFDAPDEVEGGGVVEAEREYVRISPVGAWKADVELAGQRGAVAVADTNADGIVDEQDQISISFDGEAEIWVSVGGGIGRDGQFTRLDVDPAGHRMRVQPVDIPTGEFRFVGDRIELMVRHGNASWRIDGREGRVEVPAGSVHVEYLTVHRRDIGGRSWSLTAGSFAPTEIKLARRGTHTLNFEPVRLQPAAQERPEGIEFDLGARTANGMEILNVLMGDRQPPEPQLRLTADDGTVLDVQKFHYG